MHTSRNQGSPKSIGQWLSTHKGNLAPVVVLVGVVFLAAPALAAPLALNFGYLELARRTPAPARARAFFQQAALLEPQTPRVMRAWGVLAWAEHDAAAAYSFLQRSAPSDSMDVLVHWQMGQALDAMGNPQAAAQEYEKAGAAVYFLNAARRLRHQKDWQGAERNFLRATRIAPQDATIARSAAEFYKEWNKPDRARPFIEQALAFEPTPYVRALLRGELAQLEHDTASAEREYQAAVRLKPAQPEGYRLLAELYLAGSEPTRAIRTLETGAALATLTFDLNLRLAQLLIQTGNWTAAENALARAQFEQSNSDEVYLLRGQLELARHNPVAARAALAQALNLAPYNAETHFWLGQALAQTGQCDAARRAYADALALAPDDLRFAPAQRVWGDCPLNP